MFALLPVDMLNGIVLKNGINLPISIGQLFKLVILIFIFFRFLFKPKLLLVSLGFTALLFLPSIYQSFKIFSVSSIFEDIVKISKYLTPLYCFLFFADFIKRDGYVGIVKLRNLIRFSYIVLVGNILLKYIGLGYPMYEYGSIGSKGFFYAGNEISALLVILSSFMAFDIWNRGKKIQYFLLWAFTLFVGLTVSSKTGIVGILLIFFLIPLKRPSLKINLKSFIFFLASIFLIIPLSLFLIWRSIQGTAFFIRLQYFSEKFDFWTFLLSSRNIFFKEANKTYKEKYDFIEKIMGVGQTQYENLNHNQIVEIDFADIFFAYGLFGLLYFGMLMSFLIVQAVRFSSNKRHIYSNYVLLMIWMLIGISATAGHVFSSGMAAVFIGIVFALMYFKEKQEDI